MTERALASVDANWTGLGDWIEHSYSEEEMLAAIETVRKEERARMPRRNGHTLLRDRSRGWPITATPGVTGWKKGTIASWARWPVQAATAGAVAQGDAGLSGKPLRSIREGRDARFAAAGGI